MSHFSVLVAIPEDDGEQLKAALQPYHEFECTGDDDQYVQDIDETDEYKSRYETQTYTRLKAPDGTLHYPYDDLFYREPTDEEKPKVGMGSGCGGGLQWKSKDWGDGKGYRPKVLFVPEGYEEIEVPAKDIMSFAQYVHEDTGRPIVKDGGVSVSGDEDSGKYGYIKVNDDGDVISIINRTNPNKRWDYWTIGGRWSNRLRLKASDTGEIVYTDYAKKSDIDFDAMFKDGRAEGEEIYAKYMRDVTGSWEPWKTFLRRSEVEEFTISEARDLYHGQEWLKKAKENAGGRAWGFKFDDLLVGKEQYAKQEGEAAIRTFALLHAGKWFEKGQMGFWGAVFDEKDGDQFHQGYMDIIKSIPDDYYLVVVDCHI